MCTSTDSTMSRTARTWLIVSALTITIAGVGGSGGPGGSGAMGGSGGQSGGAFTAGDTGNVWTGRCDDGDAG